MLLGGHLPYHRRLFLFEDRDLEKDAVPLAPRFPAFCGVTDHHTDWGENHWLSRMKNSVASLGERGVREIPYPFMLRLCMSQSLSGTIPRPWIYQQHLSF